MESEQDADGQSAFWGVSVVSGFIESFPSVEFSRRRMPSLLRSWPFGSARFGGSGEFSDRDGGLFRDSGGAFFASRDELARYPQPVGSVLLRADDFAGRFVFVVIHKAFWR
jgi:hypothetical protein